MIFFYEIEDALIDLFWYFKGRERHLEDVIESKTAALNQSDRLLAQFRCRQVQADAEVSWKLLVLKLLSVFIEFYIFTYFNLALKHAYSPPHCSGSAFQKL